MVLAAGVAAIRDCEDWICDATAQGLYHPHRACHCRQPVNSLLKRARVMVERIEARAAAFDRDHAQSEREST
jgi:hypothetical protein